jgi:hypothetical protein
VRVRHDGRLIGKLRRGFLTPVLPRWRRTWHGSASGTHGAVVGLDAGVLLGIAGLDVLQLDGGITTDNHNRSYRYFRCGWFLGAIRVGRALNMDAHGACHCTCANAGLFLRKVL